jgi:hypothetical protein
MSEDIIDFKWAVDLMGDEFDLKAARELFKNGKKTCIREQQIQTGRHATLMMTHGFEDLSSATEVDEAAGLLTDFLNGILFVTDESRKPVRHNGVYKRQADGNWGEGVVLAQRLF